MTLRIGILSDTHLYNCDNSFIRLTEAAFGTCDAIVHAGDITDLSVLEAFSGKNIFAVHGNMCNMVTTDTLPEYRIIDIEKHRIAICHGAGNRHNIEARLFERFHDTDCIIYGHTHQPTIKHFGNILFINPGSFLGTGPYGSSGTYAILEINSKELKATIHELKEPL